MPLAERLYGYFASDGIWLGLSYAVAAAFTVHALAQFRQNRKSAAAGAAGGAVMLGALYAAGCFLLGCCGSPMLAVYLGLFGARGAGLAGPLVFAITLLSVGLGWRLMKRKTVCACGDGAQVRDPSPCCSQTIPAAGAQTTDRDAHLRRGLRLEYLTVGWNVIEGLVSVTAAVGAKSVALLGFGIDSFVETASGLVLIWRLRAEKACRDSAEVDRLDRRAHKLVALSLFLLAAYVAFEAIRVLVTREKPEPTIVGIAVTTLSMGVMMWLARAKRQTARELSSRALEADSFQTTACWWLSLVTLCGIGANAVFGWWWADPAAALGMTWFIVREGREAWRGEECGCAC